MFLIEIVAKWIHLFILIYARNPNIRLLYFQIKHALQYRNVSSTSVWMDV